MRYGQLKNFITLIIIGNLVVSVVSCEKEAEPSATNSETIPKNTEVMMNDSGTLTTNEGDDSTGTSRKADENPYADLREEYKGDPEGYLAAIYAQKFGITVEEAKYRFEIQDKAGTLGAELDAAGLDNYGGFWIQHEPNYCLVAAFAGDNGEELIAPYREKYPDLAGLIEVHRVTYTFKELLDAQETVSAKIESLGVFASSGTYIMDNKVEITVTDMSVIDEALAEGTLVIPDCVEIGEGERPVLVEPSLTEEEQK